MEFGKQQAIHSCGRKPIKKGFQNDVRAKDGATLNIITL